ncbi:MAG: HAD family hydrolase [Oscillibacter sp.]
MDMTKRYKGVFFDLGGTLRIAFHPEAYERHARRKLAELAGSTLPVEEFFQMVEARYEPYRKWALGENREAGDEELWCKWLLPDYDPHHIRSACHELSFQYRQASGYRLVVDGGVEVIKALHARGYKLGIISNLIGEHEVPDWLEEDGLDSYFDSVVLSSTCHVRKPDPEIYRIAAGELGLDLADCVSVADNAKRDLPGALAAGMGCNILFNSPERKQPLVQAGDHGSDAVVNDFRELLDLLPALE